MTASRFGLVMVLLSFAHACGGVEPTGPSWPTTLQTGSDDGCAATTAADESGAAPVTTGCADSTTGECVPGSESCPCTLGGGCDADLMCLSDVCVSLGCPIGTEGCPCTQGGACDLDLVCTDDVCGR